MEHRTLEQVKRLAEFHPGENVPVQLTRRQRLERWAELLERHGDRRLNMLTGTEYRFYRGRDGMRCEGSPISVAYEDPVLRNAGLRDDTYGAAKDFFQLSHGQLHSIVCHCYNGFTERSQFSATRVRQIAGKASLSGLLQRAWRAFPGW